MSCLRDDFMLAQTILPASSAVLFIACRVLPSLSFICTNPFLTLGDKSCSSTAHPAVCPYLASSFFVELFA
jgi:hypothetical protein